MSDTKIQLRNNKNRELVNRLKELYKQEKSIRLEMKFINNQIKDKQLYIKNYEIEWCLKVLKDNLKCNKSMINMVRENLIIC